jgi:D-alanine-D-alanine ligase
MPWLPLPPKLLPTDDTKILEKALIVKPNQWGSSLATTKAKTPEELQSGIRSVNEVIESLTRERIMLLSNWEKNFTRHFPPLTDLPLVQECIEWREFTVWVYRDESGTHVLPIIEILTLKGEFFDYEEKYETDGSNEVFTNINPKLRGILESKSSQIYDHLGCRGIVRIDWRYDGEDIYFLEVNTIPGFTSGSLVPKMWKKAGKTEEEFVEMLMI